MNQRLLIFLCMIGLVFGYTIYEALRLDSKLSQSIATNNISIKEIPKKIEFSDINSNRKLLLDDELNQSRTIFIHFWATWCGPCEVEFPELVKMINNFKDNPSLRFLLVAVNDQIPQVKKFLKKFKIENTNVLFLMDSSNQFQQFGTYKLPETYFFDQSGKLIRKFPGKESWMDSKNLDILKSP